VTERFISNPPIAVIGWGIHNPLPLSLPTGIFVVAGRIGCGMFGILSNESEGGEEREEQSHVADIRKDAINGVLGEMSRAPVLYGEVRQTKCMFKAYKATNESVVTGIIPPGSKIIAPEAHAQMSESFPHPKFRTNRFVPVRIESFSEYEDVSRDPSIHAKPFEYEAGEVSCVSEVSEDTHTVCAEGIHFFRKKVHARQWLKEFRSHLFR